MSFEEAVSRCLAFVEDKKFGIELDLDVVGKVLSSAMDPVGVSGVHARKYVFLVAREGMEKVVYFHICEGAVTMKDGRTDEGAAKLVSYLVSDFIKELSS